MTASEIKTEAGKAANSVGKSHWPNAIMSIVGAGFLAFAITKPEQSDALVTAVIGLITTGIAGLNAARVGSKRDTDQRTRQLATKIDNTPDDIVTMLAPVIGEAISGLRRDLDSKHDENKTDHQLLLEQLAADRKTDDQQHAEHREEIARLKAGHEKLDKAVEEVSDKVDKLVEHIDPGGRVVLRIGGAG